jgi:hypothetical protein
MPWGDAGGGFSPMIDDIAKLTILLQANGVTRQPRPARPHIWHWPQAVIYVSRAASVWL